MKHEDMKRIRRARRVIAVENFLLDLTKDYFELNSAELGSLIALMKCCGYNGRNNLGRSRSRQFWYYLTNGVTKNEKRTYINL